MYPVTKAFNNACAAPGRGISTKILFNGVTELGAAEVQEINVTEQFGSSDGVTIGAAFSSQCKVTIYKQSPALNLKNGTFIPYVGINVEESVSVVGIARVGMAIVTPFLRLALCLKVSITSPLTAWSKRANCG